MRLPFAHSNHPIARWLRGIRGRLVATYVLGAAVLAVGGVGVFYLALTHGLRDNVDTALRARATTVADEVAAGVYSTPITTAPSGERPEHDVQAFTAVYSADGSLVDSEPTPLPHGARETEPRTSPGPDTLSSEQINGETFRVLTRTVTQPDGTWTVVVGQSLGITERAESEIKLALLIVIPVLLVFVGVGTWLLSGAALRPVERMRADAQELGEHDSAGRIREPATDDSLSELARTFNALLDRLHSSLNRQRSLVADAGHELRTPLAVLQTELELAARPSRTREDLVDSITHARTEVSRLATLAEDLLLLAQADSTQALVRPQLTDIGELLTETARSYQDRDLPVTVGVDIDADDAVLAEVDPVAVRRMLDNLVANSLRHTPPGGDVTIGAAVLAPERQLLTPTLRLTVADTGPGFPADFLTHAFDRFSRADQSRTRAESTAGSGLGLAIVDTLARAHGGRATAENRSAGGAVVIIDLPMVASGAGTL